jgi:hypothetical protein
MNLIFYTYIIGVLVSAIHRQIDAASSNHLQSETEHLLPLFFNASATFFSVVFNYVFVFVSYVLPFPVPPFHDSSLHVPSFLVPSFHVPSYVPSHVPSRTFALLTFSSNAALFCHKPKAASSHSGITAKTRHTRSRGFRFVGG